MSWEYRVIKYTDPSVGYGIHEAFYNKNGEVFALSKDPCPITAEHTFELKEQLQNMLSCIDKNPLPENMQFASYIED